jgi:non-homologous end joining protein Ku
MSTAAPRSQGDIEAVIGLVRVPVKTYSVRRSGSKSGFSLVCPSCDNRLGQSLFCKGPDHHGPFDRDDDSIRRGREVDDHVVVVSQQDYDQATTADLPHKELNLAVSPRDQIVAACRPDETAYRLAPNGGGKSYALLVRMVQRAAEAGLVMWGELNLRSQKPYMLELWNGQLVIQSLCYPDDLAGTDEIELAQYSEREGLMADALVEGLVEDFDHATLTNKKQARIEAAIATAAGQEPVPVAPVVERDGADPLMAALEASLTVIKGGKTAAKPRAKKAAKKPAA